MIKHVMFFIWLICMVVAFIIRVRTRIKRKRLLMEVEQAKKRYLISAGLFTVPTILLILLMKL